MSNRFKVNNENYLYGNRPINIEVDGAVSEYNSEEGYINTSFDINEGVDLNSLTNTDIEVKISKQAEDSVIDRDINLQRLPITSVKISRDMEYIAPTMFQGCYMLRDIYYGGTYDELAAKLGSVDATFYDIPSCKIHCSDKTVETGVYPGGTEHIKRHYTTKLRHKVTSLNRNIRVPEFDLIDVDVNARTYTDNEEPTIVTFFGKLTAYAYCIENMILYSENPNITFDGKEHEFFEVNFCGDDEIEDIPTGNYIKDKCVIGEYIFNNWTYTDESAVFDGYGTYYKYANNYDPENVYYFTKQSLEMDDIVDRIEPMTAIKPSKEYYIDGVHIEQLEGLSVIEYIKQKPENLSVFTLNPDYIEWLRYPEYPTLEDQYNAEEMDLNCFSIEKWSDVGWLDYFEWNGERYYLVDDAVKLDLDGIQEGWYKEYYLLENSNEVIIGVAEEDYELYIERYEKDITKNHKVKLIGGHGEVEDTIITDGILTQDSLGEDNEWYDYYMSVPSGVEEIRDVLLSNVGCLDLPKSLKVIGDNISFGYGIYIFYRGTMEEWNAIEKKSEFTNNTYIYCTDGVIVANFDEPK